MRYSKRHKMSRRSNKRNFRRGTKVNQRNGYSYPMRGGIRF